MERSGALKNKIEVWRKTLVKNDYGEYDETWELYIYIRAYVRNHYGDQVIDNDEVFDTQKIRFTVRNQSDLIEMDQIKYNNRMYTIDFIQPDYTNRWNILQCSRINE